MNEKISVLVAIGASVTANCKPCLEFHTKKAREVGLAEEEIQEAIDVGLMVKKGATDVMRGVIQKVTGRKDAAQAYDRPLTCMGSKKSSSCCQENGKKYLICGK